MYDYEIEGYLTEGKLINFCKHIATVKDINILGEQYKIGGKQYRYDIALEILNLKYLIEFDGDSHYRDINIIKRDIIKNSLAKEYGFKMVRIPYWVQLTNITVEYYFDDMMCNIKQDYPHGFIDPKAVLPSSYCELGIKRMITELDDLPCIIKNDIIDSLNNKIKKDNNDEYIVPFLLREYIKNR